MKKQNVLLLALTLALLPAISWGGWDISTISGYGLPETSLMQIIKKFLENLLILLGIFGVLGFLVSGLMYILSFANPKLTDNAKKGMLYSILGIAVGLSGYIIIQTIVWILSGERFI